MIAEEEMGIVIPMQGVSPANDPLHAIQLLRAELVKYRAYAEHIHESEILSMSFQCLAGNEIERLSGTVTLQQPF
jgi:hypothetical protein